MRLAEAESADTSAADREPLVAEGRGRQAHDQVRLRYDGGRGGGGTGTLSIDGQKVGEGRIAKTNSNTFGIDESADVGTDENTPVVPAYKGKERFTGKIGTVTVETFPGQR